MTQAQGQHSLALAPQSSVVSSPIIYNFTITAENVIPADHQLVLWAPGGISGYIWPLFTNISVSSNGGSNPDVADFRTAQFLAPPIWENDIQPDLVVVELNGSDMQAGESITIKMGTDIAKLRAPRTAGNYEFKMAVINGSGEWSELGRVSFSALPSQPVEHHVFAPSVMKRGDTAWVKIAVWDFQENRATSYIGAMEIDVTDITADYPLEVYFNPEDAGYVEFPVIFHTDGFHQVIATVVEDDGRSNTLTQGSISGSNYTWVQDDPEFYIYWGDIHSHSGWSRDGFGPNAFDYAQFTTCLDYFSPAEHVNGNGDDTFGISQEEWNTIKHEIVTRHEPGRFIPITAYETSYFANEGGHHIVYFEHEDSDIDLIPLIPRDVYHTVFQFWEQLDLLPPAIRALHIPHFTGVFFYEDQSEPDWEIDTLSINQGIRPRLVGEEYISEYRTSWELYSEHGQSEYSGSPHPLNNQNGFWGAQDALAMGEKLSFTAFSDNHSGQPGVSGRGLGAVIVPYLDRANIFEAFRSGRTYASTGERIIIDFKINDAMMGSTIDLTSQDIPDIQFLVHGTDVIDRVEIVKWDFLTGTYGDDANPDFVTIANFAGTGDALLIEDEFQDLNFYGDAVYYLRAIQEERVENREVWAWSSPIWIDNIDTTVINSETYHILTHLMAYPNPTKSGGQLSLHLHMEQQAKGQLRIYDAQGKVWSNEERILWAGENDLSMSLEEIPPGVYWLQVWDDADRVLGRVAFVVQ